MWRTDQGAKNLTKATPSLTAGAKVSLPRFATAVALAGSGTWEREGEEGEGEGKEKEKSTENWTTQRLAPDLAILGGGLARLALGGSHELLELGEGARALVRLHLGARPGGGRQGGEGEGEVGWREGVRGEEGIPEVGECGVSLHLVLLAHRLGAGGEGEAGEVRRQGGKAREVERQGVKGEVEAKDPPGAGCSPPWPPSPARPSRRPWPAPPRPGPASGNGRTWCRCR